MAMRVRMNCLNRKFKGQEQQIIFREKPKSDIALNDLDAINNLASKIATEIDNEISEPFIQIFEYLKTKGVLTDDIAEKIFDEQDKLFEKIKNREFFERVFRVKNVGRGKGNENKKPRKYTKTEFYYKLEKFILTCTQNERATKLKAGQNLWSGCYLGNEAYIKKLTRELKRFNEKRNWVTLCREVLEKAK